jgi:outer membrane protein OmpA-like peptidoglycan-associated protein
MSDHEQTESKPHAKHRGGAHGGGGSHEEHEGAPEWLISFADNVMLQMGFFVILLAMNMKEPTTGGIGGKEEQGDPPSRLLDAAIAIREAFNNPVDMSSTDPSDAALVQRLLERKRTGLSADAGPEGDKQDHQSIRPSDYVAPNGLIPFDDGLAAVTPAARETAIDVARELAGQRFIVEVRGNVSSAEAARTDDRGMRLSYERALAVALILEEHGLKWRQIRIVPLGDTSRITPRAADGPGHRSNQRVEVFQTADIMPDDPYSRDPSDPGPR